jgi:hypothetical protein
MKTDGEIRIATTDGKVDGLMANREFHELCKVVCEAAGRMNQMADNPVDAVNGLMSLIASIVVGFSDRAFAAMKAANVLQESPENVRAIYMELIESLDKLRKFGRDMTNSTKLSDLGPTPEQQVNVFSGPIPKS